MLNDAIKAQLKDYFQRIVRPIELVASLDDRPVSRETLELLQELSSRSPQPRRW